MNTDNPKDVTDIAAKLEKVRSQSPIDYLYIKNWIQLLLKQKEMTEDQPRRPPEEK